MGMKQLPRRTLLRGMGAALGLPVLDAMVPAFARAARQPAARRMAFVYVPNGVVMEEWVQRRSGPGPLPAALPRITQAIAPFREEVMLLTGLTHNGGRALGDGPGDHGRAGANYLTGVHPKKTYGKDIQAGISVDQIAAQKLAGTTRFASLELGCEEGVQGGNCDNGYSCAYSNSISWRTPSLPMPPEIRPRAVFERLFGAGEPDKYQKSILDAVQEDARTLRVSLGGADQRKLDEYLYSVRDIEKRMERTEAGSGKAGLVIPGIEKPGAAIPADFTEHARLMMDLMTVAFQADLTRVVTLMLAVEQSARVYREIGLSEGHHGLTHHQGDKEKIEKVTQINRLHLEQFAYLIGKLKGVKEGDGSLLDHSMIVYGSGLSDGNRHDHHDLPVLVAGRGGGSMKPGRVVEYPVETPMANLFVAMLDRMGIGPEKVGDSSGELGYLSGL